MSWPLSGWLYEWLSFANQAPPSGPKRCSVNGYLGMKTHVTNITNSSYFLPLLISRCSVNSRLKSTVEHQNGDITQGRLHSTSPPQKKKQSNDSICQVSKTWAKEGKFPSEATWQSQRSFQAQNPGPPLSRQRSGLLLNLPGSPAASCWSHHNT